MAKKAITILSAAMLLGVVAAAIDPAAAESSSPPVTLRGSGTSAATTADGNGGSGGGSDGASIVLRGSTPPPTPSFAGFPCPSGYAYDPDAGCIVSGEGSGYAAGPDYEWWYWPYDAGGRRQFRPHRHAARGFAHGSGSHAMAAAHGFGRGHR